jgi:hypothetical protein
MTNNEYRGWIKKYLDIVDKNGELIPFVPNKIQDKFLTEDMTGRDIILKARQQGFSSLILAVFARDFLLKENTYNVVIADNQDNAEALLKRVKDYIQGWCAKMGITEKDILKYNSKYELYFGAMNSTYQIGTAQNTQFGRSRTITNLHLSEVAFYPHMKEIMAGAAQAVVPTGRLILETTANGFNEFKEYWDSSRRGETSFTSHFYKASDFYDVGFLDNKRKELKLAVEGGTFEQEYPENDVECFITSGRTFFSHNSLSEYLKNTFNPITDGVIYV